METNSQSLFSDPKWAGLWEMIQATSEQMKETDRKMQETDKKLEKLSNLFTTQWGKLVEALCTPAALQVFKKTGIGINEIYRTDARGQAPSGHCIEVDIIMCDTDVAVAVEVKTTCRVEHVDYFLEQMKYFKECFTAFSNYKIYPAIAAINYNEFSDKYALRKGLFVLYPQGDGLFTLEEPQKLCEF